MAHYTLFWHLHYLASTSQNTRVCAHTQMAAPVIQLLSSSSSPWNRAQISTWISCPTVTICYTPPFHISPASKSPLSVNQPIYWYVTFPQTVPRAAHHKSKECNEDTTGKITSVSIYHMVLQQTNTRDKNNNRGLLAGVVEQVTGVVHSLTEGRGQESFPLAVVFFLERWKERERNGCRMLIVEDSSAIFGQNHQHL